MLSFIFMFFTDLFMAYCIAYCIALLALPPLLLPIPIELHYLLPIAILPIPRKSKCFRESPSLRVQTAAWAEVAYTRNPVSEGPVAPQGINRP